MLQYHVILCDINLVHVTYNTNKQVTQIGFIYFIIKDPCTPRLNFQMKYSHKVTQAIKHVFTSRTKFCMMKKLIQIHLVCCKISNQTKVLKGFQWCHKTEWQAQKSSSLILLSNVRSFSFNSWTIMKLFHETLFLSLFCYVITTRRLHYSLRTLLTVAVQKYHETNTKLHAVFCIFASQFRVISCV